MVFDPKLQPAYHRATKTYNLWKGFATKPIKGNCVLFLDHVKNVMCNRDQLLYEHVMAFFAQVIQDPGNIMGTALVFRSTEEGTGKSWMVKRIGELLDGPPRADRFAALYFSSSNPKRIYGNFNDPLATALLVHSEEAVPASHHGYENDQNELITGSFLRINAKYLNLRSIVNYVRLVITGNSDWIVPTSIYARRYTVSDVNEEYRNDNAYFGALDYEWNHGGKEALMYELAHYPWPNYNLRLRHNTGALMTQKIASLSEKGEYVLDWWFHFCAKGEAPYSKRESDGSIRVSNNDLYVNYSIYARKMKHAKVLSEDSFGTKLRDLVPKLDKNGKTIKNTNGKGVVSLIEACKVPNPNKDFDEGFRSMERLYRV